jgi:putative oxidoreductase
VEGQDADMTTIPNAPGPRDVGLLLLRIAAAVPLFFHGTQKLLSWFGGGGTAEFAAYLDGLGVPAPYLSAWLAAATEVGGALVLLAGWPVRAGLALTPLVFTMFVAAATSARNGFDVQSGGAEYPLVLGVLLVVLVLLGPGSLVLARARGNGGVR